MFDSMVKDLMATRKKTELASQVSRDDYENWKKLYTFEGLKRQRYGQSFCNHFNIQDHRIYYEQNWSRCDAIIQRDWLNKLHTE